ncbi:hypothetical protein PG990_009058 [Apiospora arundinis]|jgi:hypothetical protein|uniref:ER membrane protein complex subunit 4 n=1 Tax=Apiospora arundinis TaxID=335852 RepID=A0ABR2IRR3_9PEZI
MSTTTTIPTWVADLQSPPAAKSKNGSIPDPPGYPSQLSSSKDKKAKSSTTAVAPRKQPTTDEMDTLKLKKAWEVALGPLKNLPMTAIMMYMSGNSLQIFSIMMVFMAFKNPILGILQTQQAFERFESETNRNGLLTVKLAYVAAQLVALALGVWKVNGMGLLPTTRSDWLAWESQRVPIEYAVPGL